MSWKEPIIIVVGFLFAGSTIALGWSDGANYVFFDPIEQERCQSLSDVIGIECANTLIGIGPPSSEIQPSDSPLGAYLEFSPSDGVCTFSYVDRLSGPDWGLLGIETNGSIRIFSSHSLNEDQRLTFQQTICIGNTSGRMFFLRSRGGYYLDREDDNQFCTTYPEIPHHPFDCN